MNNSNKIILDLCGGTGSSSAPYVKAGYDVRVITLPDQDVRLFRYTDNPVYGILAAMDCTHFAGSGAQYWAAKDQDGRTLEALSILDACCRIILTHKPKFWAIENPIGRTKDFIGPVKFYFDPCDYGDAYTKRTCLWGDFNIPRWKPIRPERACPQGSWLQQLGGRSEKTKRLRSVTPPAFSKAFFEANR